VKIKKEWISVRLLEDRLGVEKSTIEL